MFVGEGPGVVESKTGRPFCEIAPAGAELTRYCNGYTIPDRSEIYITNLVKEWVGGTATKKQDVTPDDVARDEWELQLELGLVRPSIVATLGRHSTRWFLGPTMEMGSCHGLLYAVWWCEVCGSRGSHTVPGTYAPLCGNCLGPRIVLYVMPIYHPAAGLHQPDLAARTAYDFAQLAGVLKHPEGLLSELCWQPSAPGTYGEYHDLEEWIVS